MVSVIMPVYNGEKYLKECINSVLNQPYKDIEIITFNEIVDKLVLISENLSH